MTFKAHYVTLFYLIRSYWYVITAPIIRISIQYVLYRNTRVILPFEIVLLMLSIVCAVIRWLCMSVTITNDYVEIEKGFFVNRRTKLPITEMFSIHTSENVFNALFGCVVCKFCTTTKSSNNPKVILRKKDANKILGLVFDDSTFTNINRCKKIYRFLLKPAAILIILVLFSLIHPNSKIIFILMVLDLVYGALCLYDFKYGKIYIGDSVFIKTTNATGIQEHIFSKKSIGIVKIIQNPFDKRNATCKLKISEWGKSQKALRIGCLHLKDVVGFITKEYLT